MSHNETHVTKVIKYALIYTRRSTEKQDSTHESQEQECRAWAKLKGYHPRGVFTDDCSGSIPVNDRIGFLRAVNELKCGEVIIIKRRDRLGRDAMVNAMAESYIERQGGKIITTEIGETDSPEGKLIKGIMDQFAQFELALIRERTKAALALRQSKGLVTGQPPLGKSVNNLGYLIVNESEKTWIKLAKTLRSDGYSHKNISLYLEAVGCTARSGRPPSISTVSRWCQGSKLGDNRGGRRPKSGRKSNLNPLIRDIILHLHEQGYSIRKIAKWIERYPEAVTNNQNPLAPTQIARVINANKLDFNQKS
jgi:DNA invertase Pin-like site-specific DNA recombinase